MMRGGPKGRIHMSCNPCKMDFVVLSSTMQTCVSLPVAAATNDDPCSTCDSANSKSCCTTSLNDM
eukprot:12905141-Prorocentrum_lima.AAC.1